MHRINCDAGVAQVGQAGANTVEAVVLCHLRIVYVRVKCGCATY